MTHAPHLFRKAACLALALTLGGCIYAAPPPPAPYYPYYGTQGSYYGGPGYYAPGYYPAYPVYGPAVGFWGGWGGGGRHRW